MKCDIFINLILVPELTLLLVKKKNSDKMKAPGIAFLSLLAGSVEMKHLLVETETKGGIRNKNNPRRVLSGLSPGRLLLSDILPLSIITILLLVKNPVTNFNSHPGTPISDNLVIATLGSNSGISASVEILQSYNLNHKVARFF